MSRTVKVKLDEQSINDLVISLQMYRTSKFDLAVLRALDKLANGAKEIIQKAYASIREPYLTDYDPSITVTASKGGRKGSFWFEVTANGEQVGFLEFGAGALTDETHPYADEAPFPVFMGSWSNSPEGAGTWLKWLESGKDPLKYPFNREPRYAMYAAGTWIRQNYYDYVVRELRSITL